MHSLLARGALQIVCTMIILAKISPLVVLVLIWQLAPPFASSISFSPVLPALLAFSRCRSVNAASAEKENEVKSILQRMESDALAFRDAIERVYGYRCKTATLAECSEANFNGCSSTFPNQVCMAEDELVISACGDGASCNALWDKTQSTVSIPAALATGDFGNPSDPELIETACYSRLAEPFMIDKYEADVEYWNGYGVHPSWTYFGAHNGLFRKIPATHQEQCGLYDPRRRPWYVAAQSGPKDVILVIDQSGSMNDYGRMNIAKEAATTVVETLTVADRVAVVSFSSAASQIGEFDTLIRATVENKKRLIEAIKSIEAGGSTNFYDAFSTAFDALEKTAESEVTSGCNVAVLFLTDGQITEGPGADSVVSLVNERTQNFSSNYARRITIFTFSLGQQADHEVPKSIACSTSGIWTPVDDLTDDLVSAMSSYYKLFALGLGEGDNEDFVSWVEPYKFHTAEAMGTTVSAPVFDRSVRPPQLLGVVGIDMYMDALAKILGEDASSSTMLDRFVMLSTARCPEISLTECELDALRFLGGGAEATCGVCNGTSYAGIIPEKCPLQSEEVLPNNLFQNTDLEGTETYEERACCEAGGIVPSESCPAEGDPAVAAIIAIVFLVLVCCCCCCGCCYFFLVKRREYQATAVPNQSIAAVISGNVTTPAKENAAPVPLTKPTKPSNDQTEPDIHLGTAYNGVSMVPPPHSYSNSSAPPFNPKFDAVKRY
ncbi:hypothetical protein ACHAWF_009001 [Thalassiosira exigua]